MAARDRRTAFLLAIALSAALSLESDSSSPLVSIPLLNVELFSSAANLIDPFSV